MTSSLNTTPMGLLNAAVAWRREFRDNEFFIAAVVLAAGSGGVLVRQIRALSKLSPSNISVVLQRLEKRQLVESRFAGLPGAAANTRTYTPLPALRTALCLSELSNSTTPNTHP